MQGYLRAATADDMDLLFTWANDPLVRKHSFSSHEIGYEEHKQWFAHILSSDDCRQYIYMYDARPAGQIRLEASGGGKNMNVVISYSVCAEQRGLGHGRRMLLLACEQAALDFPRAIRLIGKTKPENAASQKAFRKAGFMECQGHVFEKRIRGEEDGAKIHKVLFLTNNDIAMRLYTWLSGQCEVSLCSDRVSIEQLKRLRPDLLLSYNYKYKIQDDVIAFMEGRILNLHISLLPWNRGASPNIWSFVDHTPKGVTIHQISSGLDEGLILYQQTCELKAEEETFASSYQKLHGKIVELFQEKWPQIRTGNWTLQKQQGEGSFHNNRDLEALKKLCPFQWEDSVADYLNRLKKTRG